MRRALLGLFTLLAAACGEKGGVVGEEPAAGPDSPAPQHPDHEVLYPDVVDARAVAAPDGTYRFSVTLESRYDSSERYADAWRVLAPDGTELGRRILRHDHAAEQPFTRSLDGVRIPDGVDVVTIQGRDMRSGWGGATFEVEIPR